MNARSTQVYTSSQGPFNIIVEDLGGGVGLVTCFECDGTGLFPFWPEEFPKNEPCVRCKGTGREYSMIYLLPC